MSDLETRLAEALRAESEEAPDALGLADAARNRARVRRRTRAAAVGLAAVAALAVPVAVVAFGGDGDDGKAPVADDSTSPGALPEGRWESWHGVTVRVPEDWEYGDQSAWCADGGSVKIFRVTRPGGVVPAIGCTPGSSYGLAFQDIEMEKTDEPFDWPVVTQTGDAWPPGTYVGAHGVNGVLVTVAGPDREELLEVLATVEAYGGRDPNGCTARLEDERTHLVGEGTMVVCRYDTSGLLEQSELLTGSDAEDAADALDGMRQAMLDCQPADVPGPTIDMFDSERDVTIELNGACTTADGTPWGIADPDVLWWALSPGFTGDTTGLPISVLRGYDPAAR